MTTPSELREALVVTRADLQAAFHDAHDAWETKPAVGGFEEVWSPRDIAEHVIRTEYRFTAAIATACGAPALPRVPTECPTPATAAVTLTYSGATTDFIVRLLTADHLSRLCELPLPLGDMPVGGVMEFMARHAHEHAQQIRACLRPAT